MKTVRIYDPAMCCSTGVCGPSFDPDLARFAADLAWLVGQGVTVERFNLAQQPGAFAADAAVKAALEARGEAGLPLVKIGDEVKVIGAYPSRTQLMAWTGVVGDGAAVAAQPATSGGCCGPAASAARPDGSKSSCC